MNNGRRFAIFRLPAHGRNEFLPLAGEPTCDVEYVNPHDYRGGAQVLIIPGSRRTTEDLIYFLSAGGERIIREHLASGGTVLGICGGYQMLGRSLYDPLHTQGPKLTMPGLGWLPIATSFGPSGLVSDSTMELLVGHGSGALVTGRENRSGYSLTELDAACFGPLLKVVSRQLLSPQPVPAVLDNGVAWEAGQEKLDGLVSDDRRLWGTYLHMICHNPAFLRSFLECLP